MDDRTKTPIKRGQIKPPPTSANRYRYPTGSQGPHSPNPPNPLKGINWSAFGGLFSGLGKTWNFGHGPIKSIKITPGLIGETPGMGGTINIGF